MTDIPLREFVEREIVSLKELIEQRFDAQERALSLQASEYERRLIALNHAHEKAIEVQHTYVTQDKYDDRLKAEAEARETALTRIDEKFDDYIKRYEQRQREVDLLLQAHQGAVAAAERAAEKATAAAQTEADKASAAARDAAAEQGRKNTRNIGIASVALTAVIVAMSLIGAI